MAGKPLPCDFSTYRSVLLGTEIPIHQLDDINYGPVPLLPPALRILSRAFSVTRRAQRVILGTSKILRSLVTVPTQTASLLALPSFLRFLTRRARDSGGRLILLMKSLLRMILLNLASVLLARNL